MESNIHEIIERLKRKIAASNMDMKEIDRLNEVDAYINQLEEKITALPESALLETFDEMIPANVIIQNATIYVGNGTPPALAPYENSGSTGRG